MTASSVRCLVLTQLQAILSCARKEDVQLGSHLSKLNTFRRLIQKWDTTTAASKSASSSFAKDPRSIFVPFLDLLHHDALNQNSKVLYVLLRTILQLIPACLNDDDDTITTVHLPNGIAADAMEDIVEAISTLSSTINHQGEGIDTCISQILHQAIVNQGRHCSDHIAWTCIQTCYRLTSKSSTSITFDLLREMITSVFKLQVTRVKYGVPCAVKILGFLCQKLLKDEAVQQQQQHCLTLLYAALDSAGHEIENYPSLVSFVKDDVCGAVLRIGRLSATSSGVESTVLCLSIIRVLWINLRQHLKMQMEAIMNGIFIHALHWIHDYIKDPENAFENSTSTIVRSVSFEILECLVDLLSESSLLPDLYVNYDCDERRTNVTENLFNLLSEVVVASRSIDDSDEGYENVLEYAVHLPTIKRYGSLALEGIFNSVWVLYNRSSASSSSQQQLSPSGSPKKKQHRLSLDSDGCLQGFQRAEELWKCRQLKQFKKTGAEHFTHKPKDGLKFLQSHDILSTPLCAKQVASFLRSLPPGLDKAAVGSFLGTIGKEDEGVYEGDTVSFHAAVLSAFVASFNFSGQSLLESLRMFLASFRLPGEAQQIDRILNAFSTAVYEQSSDRQHMASVDVAYLLSFSIIMLNTDLHNPNIKEEKKMKLTDFHRNNLNYGQEVSLGQDLPLHFLDSIYDSIKDFQIRTCSDHGAQAEVTSDRWKDMLYQAEADPTNSTLIVHHRSSKSPSVVVQSDLDTYDRYIVRLLYEKMDSAFSSVFKLSSSSEFTELQMASNGYMLFAAVASHVELNAEFNSLFAKLCVKTRTIDYSKKIDVDAYYANRGAQLAMVAAMTLASSCSHSLDTDGWSFYLSVLIRLREMKVLPKGFGDNVLDVQIYNKDEYLSLLKQIRLLSTEREELAAVSSLKSSSTSILGSVASFFGKTNAVTSSTTNDHAQSVKDLFDTMENKADDIKNTSTAASAEWIESSLKPYGLDKFLSRSTELPLESLRCLVMALISLAEGVVLPPKRRRMSNNEDGNEKCQIITPTPGGSIYAEHQLSLVLHFNKSRVFVTSSDFWEGLLKPHYTEITLRLVPLIQGNLVVNHMEFETACYLLVKLSLGLLVCMTTTATSTNSSCLNDVLDLLVKMDEKLLGMILPQVASSMKFVIEKLDCNTTWEKVFKVLEKCRLYHRCNKYVFEILQLLTDRIRSSRNAPPFSLARVVRIALSFSDDLAPSDTTIVLDLLEVVYLEQAVTIFSASLFNPESTEFTIFTQVLCEIIRACFHPTLRQDAMLRLRRTALENNEVRNAVPDEVVEEIFISGVLPATLAYMSKDHRFLRHYQDSLYDDDNSMALLASAFANIKVHEAKLISDDLSSHVVTLDLISWTFLHHLEAIHAKRNFSRIWNQILDIFYHYLACPAKYESVLDEVKEHLKNLVLVMASYKYFDVVEGVSSVNPLWQAAVTKFSTVWPTISTLYPPKAVEENTVMSESNEDLATTESVKVDDVEVIAVKAESDSTIKIDEE